MKVIESRQDRPRLARLRGLLLGLAAGGLVAACSVAASPSPTAALPSTPPPRTSTQVPATPTPTPTQTGLPSVDIAPAGQWSGIKWISAGPVFPQTPIAGIEQGPYVQVYVFGWSRGYVGFRSVEEDVPNTVAPSFTLVSTSSADGLNWTAGRALDIGGLGGVDISAVVEGPAGLLAVGFSSAGRCGPEAAEALWTSPDGLIWTRVELPGAFSTVDGGSTGYIATGTLNKGVTPAVWLSGDGRSWHQVPLPKATSGAVVVDGATDFAGGYVLAGTQRSDNGCVESESTPSLYIPSLWWSADGKSWTRSKLSGALPAGGVSVGFVRISDHALMAVAHDWNVAKAEAGPEQVWVSNDGRTWRLVESPSSILLSNCVLTNGQRGLAVLPDDGPTIATVGDDLTVTTLSQSGDGPVASATTLVGWMSAFGPTGVVALSVDGLNLWLRVPTAS